MYNYAGIFGRMIGSKAGEFTMSAVILYTLESQKTQFSPQDGMGSTRSIKDAAPFQGQRLRNSLWARWAYSKYLCCPNK